MVRSPQTRWDGSFFRRRPTAGSFGGSVSSRLGSRHGSHTSLRRPASGRSRSSRQPPLSARVQQEAAAVQGSPRSRGSDVFDQHLGHGRSDLRVHVPDPNDGDTSRPRRSQSVRSFSNSRAYGDTRLVAGSSTSRRAQSSGMARRSHSARGSSAGAFRQRAVSRFGESDLQSLPGAPESASFGSAGSHGSAVSAPQPQPPHRDVADLELDPYGDVSFLDAASFSSDSDA